MGSVARSPEANGLNSIVNQAGALPCREVTVATLPIWEQPVVLLQSFDLAPVADRVTRLIHDFELYRIAGRLLNDFGSTPDIAAGEDV